jgi:TetR/AcrR family transcriptional repressor of nem operon
VPKPNVREKIVDAALYLFHTRGYNGSGVNDIVVTAGVPKGSFYNHFVSKEALGLETIARYWSDFDIESLKDHDVPPLVRLRRHFEHLAERFGDCGYSRGCLLGNFGSEMADANPKIREALSVILAAWTDAIAGVLREARDAGVLPADKDVDKFARFLMDAWEGCLIRGKVMKDRSALDDFFDITFGCLLR